MNMLVVITLPQSLLQKLCRAFTAMGVGNPQKLNRTHEPLRM